MRNIFFKFASRLSYLVVFGREDYQRRANQRLARRLERDLIRQQQKANSLLLKKEFDAQREQNKNIEKKTPIVIKHSPAIKSNGGLRGGASHFKTSNRRVVKLKSGKFITIYK